MTKQELIKTARYFGGSIGCEFIYNDNLYNCTGVLFYKNSNRLLINMDIINGPAVKGLLFELPKNEKELKYLRLKEDPVEDLKQAILKFLKIPEITAFLQRLFNKKANHHEIRKHNNRKF